MERVVINTVEGPMPAWQGRAHTLRVSFNALTVPVLCVLTCMYCNMLDIFCCMHNVYFLEEPPSHLCHVIVI